MASSMRCDVCGTGREGMIGGLGRGRVSRGKAGGSRAILEAVKRGGAVELLLSELLRNVQGNPEGCRKERRS